MRRLGNEFNLRTRNVKNHGDASQAVRGGGNRRTGGRKKTVREREWMGTRFYTLKVTGRGSEKEKKTTGFRPRPELAV